MKVTQFIKKNDLENQYNVLKNSNQQIESAWSKEIDIKNINKANINSIVITGLGGSAISGDVLVNLFSDQLKINCSINRNYSLPKYANENTLVIVISYSGETEETLSALCEAIDRKCKIICISSGGKVKETASAKNLVFAEVDKGYQPRFAFWIIFFTLLKVFQLLNLIPNLKDFVIEAVALLKQKAAKYGNDKNIAIEIAESLIGYIPIIYSVADSTFGIGLRYKTQFNENSKIHSFHNVLPEMNHNEIIGWETRSSSNFKVINIIDDSYNDRIKKRFEITNSLVDKTSAQIINIKSNEKDFRLRILDLIYLGDWISYYLAVLRNYDPSSIKNIKYLKEKLAEN